MFLAADTNNDDRIELEEFIRMVATMLRGSRTQKMECKSNFLLYYISCDN